MDKAGVVPGDMYAGGSTAGDRQAVYWRFVSCATRLRRD